MDEFLSGKLKDDVTISMLKDFYAWARFGSLKKAEDALNKERTNISKSVIHLESILGVKLLERYPEGVELTFIGEILFEKLRITFGAMDDFERILDRRDGFTHKRPFRIATTLAMGSLLMPIAIAEFKKKYPQYNITLNMTDTFPELGIDNVDMVVWPQEVTQEDIVSIHIVSYGSKLYASPEYLKTHGIPKTLKDLEKHILIGSELKISKLNYAYDWIEQLLRAQGVKINRDIITNNTFAGIKMAEEGAGITRYAPSMVQRLGLKVINILPDIEGPESKVYISYKRHLEGTDIINEIIPVIRNHLY